MLLILLALQFVGFFLLRSLEDYYLASFTKNLMAQGRVLSGLLERYPLSDSPGGAGPGSDTRLDSEEDMSLEIGQLLKAFGRQSGLQIGVFNSSGTLVATSSVDPVEFERATIGSVVARSIGGNEAKEQRIHPSTGERLLHFALPVASRADTSDKKGPSGDVSGAVYLMGSLEETYSVLGDVRSMLFSATLISLAIALFLGLGVASAITHPIQELTAKAASMAKGNFDQTINVKEDDEIGRLGRMFNYLTTRLRDTLKEISSEKARLEAILVHMTDGIIATDTSGGVVAMNNTARKMLGLPERAEITPVDPMDLVSLVPDPEGRSAIANYIKRIGQGGESLAITDIRVSEGPGEEERILRAYMAPVATETGESEPYGVVVVLHDISEEERLESLRREFVADVSHELRTPLAAIKSYVETLIDGAMEDEEVSYRFLEVVDQETDRMVRLVNNLLDLSRLEYEGSSWEKGLVDMAEVAHSAIEKVSASASAKEQVISGPVFLNAAGEALTNTPSCEGGFANEAAQAGPCGVWPRLMVFGDRDRIEQVLLNLLSNAVKYTPDGGSIELKITKNRDEIVTEVKDAGVGIPKEDMPRIFERFYKVDKARSREMGGTGLGLAIAKQIIEAHGGRIWIESIVGEGTKVSFSLPEYKDENEGVSDESRVPR